MTEERVIKLEDKIDKMAGEVYDVKTDVAKIITRLDIVLDNHEKTLIKHDTDIESLKKDSVDCEKFKKLECDVEILKDSAKESKFFKSTASKIVGFIVAILIIVCANLALSYFTPKMFPAASIQTSTVENNIYNSKK